MPSSLILIYYEYAAALLRSYLEMMTKPKIIISWYCRPFETRLPLSKCY